MKQLPRTDTVGKAIEHDSSALHVAGEAYYVDDMPEIEGTLHIVPILSEIAKGKILSIDFSKVAASEGVVRVIGAEDIKGVNNCSPSAGDDFIFANKKVEFHGQVIAAVVGETRLQARHAAKLALIEYQEQKQILTARQGSKAASKVLDPFCFQNGNAEQKIAQSAQRVQNQFQIGGQEHFYLEGQVSLAKPGENGSIYILSSTQHPSEIQHLVAEMLELDEAQITCECRRMGGAFGGKESQAAQWACIAALGAVLTGKTCKIRLDRDEDIRATGKRHDFDVDYQVGFDGKGKIEAVDVNFIGRCGNSADLSLGVIDRTMFHADNSYFYPCFRINSERIKTNTVSNTAFRGFGGPQGMLFAEMMMDHIALQLDVDPLEIRKRNFYSIRKNKTPYGMLVKDNALAEMVGKLERTSNYQRRRKAIEKFNLENSFLKKGIALTPLKFGIAFTLKHLNQAGALVHVYRDGSVQINHGGTEMGQGLYMKVAQIVAEEFGVAIEKVQITATRTDKVPNTTPTAASSGSDLNGMAAKNGAQKIKNRMAKIAAEKIGVDPSNVTFSKGFVRADKRKMSFAELANLCFLKRVSLSDTGFFATPKITWDREKQTGNPFLYFAYGAACSEVIIDTLTGESKVLQVDILHDVGNSLNPAIDIGQIEGGFVQGMGWLTTEELVFDGKGALRTHAPSTYKIPTCSDVPEKFNVKLYEVPNRERTIHHSKAVGEPPLMLATSVFSAIFHAIASIKKGVVPKLNAPATPEAILNAVISMQAN